jgi:hypothetical protein
MPRERVACIPRCVPRTKPARPDTRAEKASQAESSAFLHRDKQPEKFPRAALRWHGWLCREVDFSLEEAQAGLAALALMATTRKSNAAYALADLLSRRGLERPCETLVDWVREA